MIDVDKSKPQWWEDGENFLSEMLEHEAHFMSALETVDHIASYTGKIATDSVCVAAFLYGAFNTKQVKSRGFDLSGSKKKWWQFWDRTT